MHIDGLVQEICNSIANALELRLSFTNQSIYIYIYIYIYFIRVLLKNKINTTRVNDWSPSPFVSILAHMEVTCVGIHCHCIIHDTCGHRLTTPLVFVTTKINYPCAANITTGYTRSNWCYAEWTFESVFIRFRTFLVTNFDIPTYNYTVTRRQPCNSTMCAIAHYISCWQRDLFVDTGDGRQSVARVKCTVWLLGKKSSWTEGIKRNEF